MIYKYIHTFPKAKAISNKNAGIKLTLSFGTAQFVMSSFFEDFLLGNSFEMEVSGTNSLNESYHK